MASVSGARPWFCKYLHETLTNPSQEFSLSGKYAQVLSVDVSRRELVMYDGKYSALAKLTEDAAKELQRESHVTVQGLQGKWLAPIKIFLLPDLNLVPPTAILILRRVRVFTDRVDHRPVQDPPFAVNTPDLQQMLGALHMKEMCKAVPDLPRRGQVAEEEHAEMDLSDSPPRSVRLEPIAIPPKPSTAPEGNVPCIRFSTPTSAEGANGNPSNGALNENKNEDDEASTLEVDEEDHSNALPELTMSLVRQGMLRVDSPPPETNGHLESNTQPNGTSVAANGSTVQPNEKSCEPSGTETQPQPQALQSTANGLPMTQIENTEQLSDDDESDVAEEAPAPSEIDAIPAEQPEKPMQEPLENDASAPVESTTVMAPTETIPSTPPALANGDEPTSKTVVDVDEEQEAETMEPSPVEPTESEMGDIALVPAEDVNMTETVQVEDSQKTQSQADQAEDDENEVMVEETQEETEKMLLVDDENLVRQVGSILDEAFSLLDGMTFGVGPKILDLTS